jgi:hypothetical protein
MKYHELSLFFKDKKAFVASLHLISKETDLDSDFLYLPWEPSGVCQVLGYHFNKLWKF